MSARNPSPPRGPAVFCGMAVRLVAPDTTGGDLLLQPPPPSDDVEERRARVDGYTYNTGYRPTDEEATARAARRRLSTSPPRRDEHSQQRRDDPSEMALDGPTNADVYGFWYPQFNTEFAQAPDFVHRYLWQALDDDDDAWCARTPARHRPRAPQRSRARAPRRLWKNTVSEGWDFSSSTLWELPPHRHRSVFYNTTFSDDAIDAQKQITHAAALRFVTANWASVAQTLAPLALRIGTDLHFVMEPRFGSDFDIVRAAVATDFRRAAFAKDSLYTPATWPEIRYVALTEGVRSANLGQDTWKLLFGTAQRATMPGAEIYPLSDTRLVQKMKMLAGVTQARPIQPTSRTEEEEAEAKAMEQGTQLGLRHWHEWVGQAEAMDRDLALVLFRVPRLQDAETVNSLYLLVESCLRESPLLDDRDVAAAVLAPQLHRVTTGRGTDEGPWECFSPLKLFSDNLRADSDIAELAVLQCVRGIAAVPGPSSPQPNPKYQELAELAIERDVLALPYGEIDPIILQDTGFMQALVRKNVKAILFAPHNLLSEQTGHSLLKIVALYVNPDKYIEMGQEKLQKHLETAQQRGHSAALFRSKPLLREVLLQLARSQLRGVLVMLDVETNLAERVTRKTYGEIEPGRAVPTVQEATSREEPANLLDANATDFLQQGRMESNRCAFQGGVEFVTFSPEARGFDPVQISQPDAAALRHAAATYSAMTLQERQRMSTELAGTPTNEYLLRKVLEKATGWESDADLALAAVSIDGSTLRMVEPQARGPAWEVVRAAVEQTPVAWQFTTPGCRRDCRAIFSQPSSQREAELFPVLLSQLESAVRMFRFAAADALALAEEAATDAAIAEAERDASAGGA